MKTTESEDKKELKRNRIRTYFLEAAREIVLKEGYENVSVRKVAEMAGYSYATIYNYYKDLNQLLWEVKESMIGDVFRTLQMKMDNTSEGIDGVKQGFRIYISYFLENPNIFKFLNYCPLVKPENAVEASVAGPDFDAMWEDTLGIFVANGKLKKEDIEVVSKLFIYSIQGMITLCLSNREVFTEEAVYRDMERMADFILQGL